MLNTVLYPTPTDHSRHVLTAAMSRQKEPHPFASSTYAKKKKKRNVCSHKRLKFLNKPLLKGTFLRVLHVVVLIITTSHHLRQTNPFPTSPSQPLSLHSVKHTDEAYTNTLLTRTTAAACALVRFSFPPDKNAHINPAYAIDVWARKETKRKIDSSSYTGSQKKEKVIHFACQPSYDPLC